jgi:DNA replication licensing factor MCM3
MKDNGGPVADDGAADDESPYEKNHPLLGNGDRRTAAAKIVKVEFLKKYVHYAKSRIQPEITDEASEMIVEKYSQFRQKAAELGQEKRSKVFPVTPRSLEALIRLATAHAKARLSATVDKVCIVDLICRM